MQKKLRQNQNRGSSPNPSSLPPQTPLHSREGSLKSETRRAHFLQQSLENTKRVCAEVNKLDGTASASRGSEGGAKGADPAPTHAGCAWKTNAPHPDPHETPPRPLHLDHSAVPRNEVDGELLLPPHHVGRLRFAAAVSHHLLLQDGTVVSLSSNALDPPAPGPGSPAHHFRLPPPRPRPLIGEAAPLPQTGGGHNGRNSQPTR